MSSPLIFGHRGYSARYPENTGLSFRKALEAGADGIECDVQKTRDGRFVVIHDASTDRTSESKHRGDVAAMKLAELQALCFGEGESILTLEELLKLVPGDRWVNIELKYDTISPEDSPALLKILMKHRGRERVLISSFRHANLPPFRKAGFCVGMLFGEDHAQLGLPRVIARILWVRPAFLNLPYQTFDRLGPKVARIFVGTWKRLGIRIAFWTVNEPGQFEPVAQVADALITDEVVRVREWVLAREEAAFKARHRPLS